MGSDLSLLQKVRKQGKTFLHERTLKILSYKSLIPTYFWLVATYDQAKSKD